MEVFQMVAELRQEQQHITRVIDVLETFAVNRQNGGPGTTLEMKVQYLAPVRGGRVVCRGEALRRGGTWFLRAEAHDEAGALVAFATSTWKLLRKPAPNAVAPQ